MKIAVSFVDHTEAIKAKLERKLRAGLNEAAVELAIGYREGLQENQAPPHCRPGQIPHAYMGHIPGGFGPLAGTGEIQNTPQFGFTRDQNDFLSSYIEGGVSGSGDSLKGVVGFEPSHVTSRSKNYLIQWDQGTVPGSTERRPWVMELYRRTKAAMIASFIDIARKTQ